MFFNSQKKIFFFLIIIFIQFRPAQAQSDEVRIANEYYSAGELEKARISYEKLSRKEENLLLIYSNYLNTLMSLKQVEEAEKFTKRMSKLFPDDVSFRIDHYLINLQENGPEKSQKELNSFINEIKSSSEKIDRAGALFYQKGKYEQAKETYLAGRKASGSKTAFSLGLARVYKALGEKDKMVDEVLDYVEQEPGSIESVKNTFQSNLTEKGDFEILETKLYDRVQKNPEQITLNELLLWLNIQNQNYSKAFIQAKAIDRRNKTQGEKLLEVGRIALENRDYESALRFFQYVVDEYKSGFNYSTARKLLINTKEEIVKNTYPVEEAKINSLIGDYKRLVADLGKNAITFDAMRSMALLYAFYKDNRDTAIVILNDVIAQARFDKKFVDKAKIDLADIYLLKEEPWEATLIYSQVEKSQKDEPLGHEAKLRNAKLSYYKGEFELAQGHLDVLKLATPREIANDAMDLSILIQDNIGLDSNEEAMKEYAAIDLLLFQNKTKEALEKADSLLLNFPNHSLTDEIYLLKAKLYKKSGDYTSAIKMLDNLLATYGKDIYGDDALFMKAQIYDLNLKDTEKAKELYQQLMVNYPGSIFGAEARKRFRLLRGDKL